MYLIWDHKARAKQYTKVTTADMKMLQVIQIYNMDLPSLYPDYMLYYQVKTSKSFYQGSGTLLA